MSLKDDIKVLQAALIPDNTANEISPEDVRDALALTIDNLSNLGANYYGEIIPSTAAIADVAEGATVLPLEDGTYTNFNGLIRNNELCVFVFESSAWVKKQIRDLLADHLKTLNNIVAYKYNSDFDIYTSGTSLFIKNQLQYGTGLYLGVTDVITELDLTSSVNWIDGASPGSFMFLFVENGGSIGAGSTIKVGNNANYLSYTNYIPVASIRKETTGFYKILNIIGHSLTDKALLTHINPFVYADTEFKAEFSGAILTITEQLQYQGGFNLGTFNSTENIDLDLTANWLGGVSVNAYLMVKSDSSLPSGGTLKAVAYASYDRYQDYLPVMSLLKKDGVWSVTNIMGYTQKTPFEVVNNYVNEVEEVNGAFAKLDGAILSDGSLNPGIANFKVATPIAVTELNGWVLFKDTNTGTAPNYVNCYTNDDFTGFLGRTDNSDYNSLNIASTKDIGLKMPDGTKFISFVCDHPTLTNIDTIELITVNGFNNTVIFYDNVGYSVANPLDYDESIASNYQEAPIRFQIPVNCNIADVDSNSILLQDAETLYNDWGVLMLPESYSQTGKPVRLIIGCHGAGGGVTSSGSQTEDYVLYKYLCANGYAIMDMNGLPEDYANLNGLDLVNNIGSPIAVQSYIKGVDWVFENYNVSKEGVLISGSSMGGISSSNLVLSGSLNVIAHGINAPVTDAYNHIWLNPWQSGVPKDTMIKIYDFDETFVGSGIYVYSEEKLKGYNPMLNGMFSFDKLSKLYSENIEVLTATASSDLDEQKQYPCPVKIWHCQDDPTVNYLVSVRHIDSIRNGGQIAELRSIPTGGHDPLDVGDPLVSPSGNVDYKGETLVIKPIVEEYYLWFNRYNKQ